MVLCAVAAVTALAQWLGGSAVAGTVLLVIGIFLGGYFGAGWGGKQATKTEEYRREWLGKRSKSSGKSEDEGSTGDL